MSAHDDRLRDHQFAFAAHLRDAANPPPPGIEPRRMAVYRELFRATLDAALASPPLGCEGVAQASKQIGEACKACHQDFR